MTLRTLIFAIPYSVFHSFSIFQHIASKTVSEVKNHPSCDSKRLPRASQEASKRPQERSKTPRALHEAPRAPQDRENSSLRTFSAPHKTHKMTQDTSKSSQEARKRSPRGRQVAPRGSQGTPIGLPELSKKSNRASLSLCNHFAFFAFTDFQIKTTHPQYIQAWPGGMRVAFE